ncbi:MAG TPA: hypothetical protein PL029_07740 [Bacteroidia bacterium]|nr:hypothetical protein [Bacteroidia bacterium]
MPKCNFTIPFSGSPEALIEKARKAIGEAKGNFSGDTGSGFFSLSTPLGPVNGSYNISESAIHVEIDNKPVFVGCGKIENELQKYLNG